MRRLYYSDDEFGQAFKDSLENYREVPPSGNWKKIHARLEKRRIRKYTGWIGAAAVVLTLFVLGVSINISTRNVRLQNEVLKKQAVELNATNQKATATIPSKPALSSPNVLSEKKETVSTKSFNGEAKVDDKAIAVNNPSNRVASIKNQLPKLESQVEESLTTLENILTVREQNIIESLPTLSANSISVSEANIIATHQPDVYAAADELKSLQVNCYKGYVGITAQPQHTWFYSQSAISNPKVDYRFSPGYAFGINFGSNVCNRFAIESGVILSKENQRYESVSNSRKLPAILVSTPTSKLPGEISLTYLRAPLVVKYKFHWNRNDMLCDNSLNLIGGVQYGYFLFGKSQGLESAIVLSKETVRQHDLQGMIGVERSQGIGNHFTLNYGTRLGIGITHMASSEKFYVNQFYKPHNVTAAVNLGLSWHK